MKKYLLIILSVFFLASCGVGTTSVTSGVAEKASLVVLASKKSDIVVTVDGNEFNVETVKQSKFKKDRDLKKISENIINVTPGQHQVVVTQNGLQVYSKKVFLSNGETRIIEL